MKSRKWISSKVKEGMNGNRISFVSRISAVISIHAISGEYGTNAVKFGDVTGTKCHVLNTALSIHTKSKVTIRIDAKRVQLTGMLNSGPSAKLTEFFVLPHRILSNTFPTSVCSLPIIFCLSGEAFSFNLINESADVLKTH